MNPPFLLLMPSYNQSHYIVEAVQSILAQDDPDWELWIVDNSSDQTPQVMERFSDPRIRFHHIPARMDPGSCLNWMLERALGRDFSYVHTDNNLRPSYVGRMRQALSKHPLALAYCDMRTIDERGAYTHIFQRGAFDLPRLLSVDTLGVPFAATVELAKQLGGFSSADFADDVRFCVSAFGLAEYVYVPEALMDYRLHSNSRTQEAGGGRNMHRVFVDLMPKIAPLLEKRAIAVVPVLQQAIREGLDAIDLFVEDIWYRKYSKSVSVWWQGFPRVDDFFLSGLLDVPGFSSSLGCPPMRWTIQGADGRRVMPWVAIRLRVAFRSRRGEIRRMFQRPNCIVPVWACMTLGVASDQTIFFRMVAANFRTIWAARQLQLMLGWTPRWDATVVAPPQWLGWERAEGHEPVLDFTQDINFITEARNAVAK